MHFIIDNRQQLGERMEFGFGHHITEDYHKHVQLAKLGETLGFDFVWLPDQTFFPDPYILLGAFAQATERIQIGLAVTNPNTRHPAISARSIGTLGNMAPGRIHLGIGAGNNKELLLPLGLDGSHSGPKIREMVEIIRGLLTGEKLIYRGEYFQVDGVCLDFMPPPGIQLYIAGRGPYVLQAAGEVADGVIIGALCSEKGISYALNQVHLGATKTGRDISQMRVISWLTCILTKDRTSDLISVKRSVAHIIGGAPDETLEAVGLDMDLVRVLKNAYINEGIPQAAKFVNEECADTFTIVGDEDEVIRRIKLLQNAGVTQLSINLGDDIVERQKERIQAFAEAIFPAFD